ncbi:MAG: hypothetical protein ABIJ95_04550, partial [Pseudomonadota bacterium]
RDAKFSKNLWTALFLVLALILVSGCASTLEKEEGMAPPPPETQVAGDFHDIQVPMGLSLKAKESFVISATGVISGVLVYTGRVEPESSVRFFENSMKNDAWARVSSLKSKRSMLLFKKENRWAVIQVAAGKFNTEVTIWVAPAGQGMGGAIESQGLFK